MLPFERSSMLAELRQHPLDGDDPFDVLVVGGGITGAGVALDAAHRGLRVALVERDDFASGTSSKSSKLIHGGLRYLQNGDVRLVYEALHERRRLMRNAPHMVEVLPFLIPIMTKDGVISRKIAKALGSRCGCTTSRVDGASASSTGGCRPTKAATHFPSTHLDRLNGGFLYYDATADDARLTLTIARTAAEHGAVVVNRARVVEIVHRDGRVAGAVVEADGTIIEVAARTIVNACGVWADDVRALDEGVHPGSIRPAKGVHITLPWHLVGNDIAVIIPVRRDKRSLFLVPWGPLGDGTFRHVYVGTTDTDDHGSLDEPLADGDDIDYLLEALNQALDTSTRRPITRDDITGTWAGLRPLVNVAVDHTGQHTGATKDLSRRHLVAVSAAGVVTVTGGKLTTYREMAADTVDALRDLLHRRLDEAPLHPAPPPLRCTSCIGPPRSCEHRCTTRCTSRPAVRVARRRGAGVGGVRRVSAIRSSPGCLLRGRGRLRRPTRWPPRSTTCCAANARPSARPFGDTRRGGRRRGAVAGRTRLVRRRDGTPDRPYAAMCAAEEFAGDHVANATN